MSNNLDLTQVVEAQANPEVPVNDKGGELDAALTETVTVDLTADATVSDANYRRAIRIAVTPTGSAKKLTLPAIKRLIVVSNTGTLAITVKCGSTELPLNSGSSAVFYTDGTANGLVSVVDSSAMDLGVFVPGLPTAAGNSLVFVATRAFTLPASLVGSYVKAVIGATASAVFTLKKNAGSIGTLTFAAAGTTATVSFASDVSFAAGDSLIIVNPTLQDATLADVSISLKGFR